MLLDTGCTFHAILILVHSERVVVAALAIIAPFAHIYGLREALNIAQQSLLPVEEAICS